MSDRCWYAINQAPDSSEAEVMIYDVIGTFGVSADAFVRDLKAITARTINLRLNTPGGAVTEATAIYNALRAHPARVVSHVDGLAASAGSFIAMAGEQVRMAKNAYMMIHNARAGVFGEAGDMRKVADVLDKMSANIADIYAAKSGRPAAEWAAMMKDETWFTAQEAKDAGLVDEVTSADAKPIPAPSNFAQMFLKTPPDGLRFVAASDPIDILGRSPVPASGDAGGQAIPERSTMMNGDQFRQFAAENPEAAEVKALLAQGHKAGKAEGTTEAKAALRDVLAACPGKPQMAVDAFLSGQDAATAKATFDAVTKAEADAEAKAKAALEAKDAEIRRLQALADAGGHPGVHDKPAEQSANAPAPDPSDDPEGAAKAEWQANKDACQQAFIDEKTYVAYRVAELRGQVKRRGQR